MSVPIASAACAKSLIVSFKPAARSADWPDRPEDERPRRHMDAGNEFRRLTVRADAVALLGIGAILDQRREITGSDQTASARHAFVLRSLKHPQEVLTLKRVYRQRAYLIGAYASRRDRVENLAARIAQSHNNALTDHYRAQAEELVTRDQDEEGVEHGQHVGDAFPMADVFVNAADPRQTKREIERFVEVLFGAPFVTPAPRRYMELFSMPRRKDDDGTAVRWSAAGSQPRLAETDQTYLVRELEELKELRSILADSENAGRTRAKRRMARQGLRKRRKGQARSA